MTDYLGQVSAVLEGRYSAVEAPAVQRLQTELNAATSALEAKTALQAKTQPE